MDFILTKAAVFDDGSLRQFFI